MNLRNSGVLSLLVRWASGTQYILTADEQDFHWTMFHAGLCFLLSHGWNVGTELS